MYNTATPTVHTAACAFNTAGHLAAVMAHVELCVVDLRHTRQAYRMLSVLAYASLVVLHASCTSSVTAT